MILSSLLIHIFPKAHVVVMAEKKITQFLAPFSDTEFHANSHGVIHFIRVLNIHTLSLQDSSSQNIKKELYWLAVEEFQPI